MQNEQEAPPNELSNEPAVTGVVGELPAAPLVAIPDVISWLIIGLAGWLIFTAYSVGSAYLKSSSAAHQVLTEARARLERPAEESPEKAPRREPFLKRLLTGISGARESLQEQAESIRDGQHAQARETPAIQDTQLPEDEEELLSEDDYETSPEDGLDRF